MAPEVERNRHWINLERGGEGVGIVLGKGTHLGLGLAAGVPPGTAGYMAPEVERNRHWINLERKRGREWG